MRVVVTGAAGKIAGQVLPALHHRYELVLIDIKDTNRQGETLPDVHIADLTDRDREQYRHLFQGADRVVHFGFVRPTTPASPDARYWAEQANVQMAYNVMQTAWEEGVGRVVMASSNHAADYFESLILDGAWDGVNPADRALSDNYYGWAKEAYEHLGFVFACGTMNGTPLENVQIRIGGPREDDLARVPLGEMRRVRRALAVYISDRDLQQLFVKSLECKDIRDQFGVPFQIFYGISANTHAFWSIANARRLLDYCPQDNSELRFAPLLSQHLEAARARATTESAS